MYRLITHMCKCVLLHVLALQLMCSVTDSSAVTILGLCTVQEHHHVGVILFILPTTRLHTMAWYKLKKTV